MARGQLEDAVRWIKDPAWFDLTCIHPNPTGHGELARLFTVTIED